MDRSRSINKPSNPMLLVIFCLTVMVKDFVAKSQTIYPQPVTSHRRIDDITLVWKCEIRLSVDQRRNIKVCIKQLGTKIHYETNLATTSCATPQVNYNNDRYFYACDEQQDVLTLTITVVPVAEIDFNLWSCSYRHKAHDGTSFEWTDGQDTSLNTAYKLPCTRHANIVYDVPKPILLTRPGDVRMIVGCQSDNFDWACITKNEQATNTKYDSKFWSRFQFVIDGTVKKRGDLWGRLRPHLASDGANRPWDTQKYILQTGGKPDVCISQQNMYTYINTKNRCLLMMADHTVNVNLPDGQTLNVGTVYKAEHTRCWSEIFVITSNMDILNKPVGVKLDLSQFNVGTAKHGYGKNTFPILSLNQKSDYWLLGKDSINLRDITTILIDQPSLESFSPTVYRERVAFPFTHFLTYETATVDVVTPAELWADDVRNDPRSFIWYSWDMVTQPYGWQVALDQQLVEQYYTFLLKGLTNYDYVKFGFARRVFESTTDEMFEYDCHSGYQNSDVDAAVLVMTSGSCWIDINCVDNPLQKCTNQENVNDKRCGEAGGEYQFRFIETKIGTDGITKIYKKSRPDGKRFNSKPTCASARYVCFYLKSDEPRNYAWLSTPDTPEAFVSSTEPEKSYLKDLYFLRPDATILKNECPQFEDKDFLLTQSDPSHTYRGGRSRIFDPFTKPITDDAAYKQFANANEGRKRLYYVRVPRPHNRYTLCPLTADPNITITHELSMSMKFSTHRSNINVYKPNSHYIKFDTLRELAFHTDALAIVNGVRTSITTATGDDSCTKPKCQLVEAAYIKKMCPCQNVGNVCMQTDGLPELMRKVVVSTTLVEAELGYGQLKCEALGQMSAERDFYDMVLEFMCRPEVRAHKLKARPTDMIAVAKHAPEWTEPTAKVFNENLYTVSCPTFSDTGCQYDNKVYLVLDYEQLAGYRTVTKHVLFTQDFGSRRVMVHSLNHLELPFGMKSFYELPPHEYIAEKYSSYMDRHTTAHVYNVADLSVDAERNVADRGRIEFQVENRWLIKDSVVRGKTRGPDTTLPIYTQAWCAYPDIDMVSKRVSIQKQMLNMTDHCWRDVYYSSLRITAAQRWLECSVMYGSSDKSVSCPTPEVTMTIGEEGAGDVMVKKCDGNRTSTYKNTEDEMCETDRKRAVVKLSVKVDDSVVTDTTNVTCSYTVPANTIYNPRDDPNNTARVHGVYRKMEKKDITRLECYVLDDSVKLETIVKYDSETDSTQVLCVLPKFIPPSLPVCENSAQQNTKVDLKAIGSFTFYENDPNYTTLVSKDNAASNHCSSYLTLSGISCSTSSPSDDHTVLAVSIKNGFAKTFLFHTQVGYYVDFSCDMGNVSGRVTHDAEFNNALQNEIADDLGIHKKYTPNPIDSNTTDGNQKTDSHNNMKKSIRHGISTKNIAMIGSICGILGVVIVAVVIVYMVKRYKNTHNRSNVITSEIYHL